MAKAQTPKCVWVQIPPVDVSLSTQTHKRTYDAFPLQKRRIRVLPNEVNKLESAKED